MMGSDLFDPNEKARALTGRDYVSYSALSTYQQCPLRYYFRYVARLPEEVISAGLVFGRAMHAAVEHHFRAWQLGLVLPDLDDLVEVYRQNWQGRDAAEVQFGPDDDQETLTDLARRMLRAFQVSDLARPAGTIVSIEQEIRGTIAPGVPDLLARLDLLIDTGEALVVTDLKTSRGRWSADQVDSSAEQLLLYGALVGQARRDRAIRLEFGVITKSKLPLVERHAVPMSEARLRRSRRTVERVWQAIEAGHFYPAPSLMSCPSCPFRAPCRAWSA